MTRERLKKSCDDGSRAKCPAPDSIIYPQTISGEEAGRIMTSHRKSPLCNIVARFPQESEPTKEIFPFEVSKPPVTLPSLSTHESDVHCHDVGLPLAIDCGRGFLTFTRRCGWHVCLAAFRPRCSIARPMGTEVSQRPPRDAVQARGSVRLSVRLRSSRSRLVPLVRLAAGQPAGSPTNQKRHHR